MPRSFFSGIREPLGMFGRHGWAFFAPDGWMNFFGRIGLTVGLDWTEAWRRHWQIEYRGTCATEDEDDRNNGLIVGIDSGVLGRRLVAR
jgi:hypothetical protein